MPYIHAVRVGASTVCVRVYASRLGGRVSAESRNRIFGKGSREKRLAVLSEESCHQRPVSSLGPCSHTACCCTLLCCLGTSATTSVPKGIPTPPLSSPPQGLRPGLQRWCSAQGEDSGSQPLFLCVPSAVCHLGQPGQLSRPCSVCVPADRPEQGPNHLGPRRIRLFPYLGFSV